MGIFWPTVIRHGVATDHLVFPVYVRAPFGLMKSPLWG